MYLEFPHTKVVDEKEGERVDDCDQGSSPVRKFKQDEEGNRRTYDFL